jgi:hypothetical protein
MSENIKRIRAVRAGNRAVLTKLAKEAETYLADSTAVNEDIKGRLETINTMINEKMTMVTNLDEKVLELCEIEEIQTEIEEADDIKSRTLDIKRAISALLVFKPDDKVSKVQESNKSVETSEQLHVSEGGTSDGVQNQTLHATSPGIEPSTQSTIPDVESTDQSPTNDSISANQVETSTVGTNQPIPCQVVRPKLPKLVLNKFKGNITHWASFWDSYKTAVHENPALSTIDKFNYLNSLLEGVAARSIQGLSLTADNYNSAVDILHKRFGKTQQVITSHMDELLKLPAFSSCFC